MGVKNKSRGASQGASFCALASALASVKFGKISMPGLLSMAREYFINYSFEQPFKYISCLLIVIYLCFMC